MIIVVVLKVMGGIRRVLIKAGVGGKLDQIFVLNDNLGCRLENRLQEAEHR